MMYAHLSAFTIARNLRNKIGKKSILHSNLNKVKSNVTFYLASSGVYILFVE